MANRFVLPLENAKNALFPYMTRNIFNLANNRHQWTDDEMDRAYFTYLCIMNRQNDIENILNDILNNHGAYALYLFINAPLPRHNTLLQQNGPPLLYAVLWNNDPDLIRLLYYYGADFNWVDQRGLYINEMIQHYIYEPNLWEFVGIPPPAPGFPLEHLNDNNPNALPIPYMTQRNPENFNLIIQEFNRIVGEEEHGDNWVSPMRNNVIADYAPPMINLENRNNYPNRNNDNDNDNNEEGAAEAEAVQT